MQWLFILMASNSAAVALQDAAEPHPDKLPFLNNPAPIGSNSDVPNFLAFNSATNSDPNPEIDPGTLEISTQNSDKPAFNFNALGSSLPSVLFQSAPPLDLAFNSRIPGVHRNENPIDVNPGTVAQNSVSSCASDSTQATKGDRPIQCDIIDPNSYIWPPQANDNSIDTPTGGKPDDKELMARKAKDLEWLYNHPEAIVSQETINICARKDGIIRRLLPFCCAFVITWYPEETWGPDITDEAGCSGLIGGRPWCEDWKHWVCCNRAEFTGNNLVNTLQWGWEGINCAPFH